jgi:hypothetical protein
MRLSTFECNGTTNSTETQWNTYKLCFAKTIGTWLFSSTLWKFCKQLLPEISAFTSSLTHQLTVDDTTCLLPTKLRLLSLAMAHRPLTCATSFFIAVEVTYNSSMTITPLMPLYITFFCSRSALQAGHMVSPCYAIKMPLLTTPHKNNNTKKQSAKSNSTLTVSTLEKTNSRSFYVADASYNNIFAMSGYQLIRTNSDGYKKISPNCMRPFTAVWKMLSVTEKMMLILQTLAITSFSLHLTQVVLAT